MGLFKRRRVEPDPLVAGEPAQPGESIEIAVELVPQPEESPEVRALRAQIKVLEEALQRVVDPPGLEEYRTQVRAAVQAVALGTRPDADPRLAVARVAAAIERIDLPAVGRTVLPHPIAVPPPAVAAGSGALRAVDAVEPVEHAEPARSDEPAEPAEPEVVLPVPPPAPVEHRRARRRLRGSAA